MAQQQQLMRGQLDNETALNYILAAGNGRNLKRTFTFVDRAMNQRFTFKITEQPDNKVMRFVKLLNGPDNVRDYKYFAYLKLVNGSFTYHYGGAKAKVNRVTPSVQMFETVISFLRAKAEKRFIPEDKKAMFEALENNIEIWHEGKCGRCGRKLTVPSSVHNGYGPECIQMAGNHYHF